MLTVTLDIYLSLITKVIIVWKWVFSRRFKTCKSSVFKKNDGRDKEYYRPVSILFNVPKVFERIMYSQINAFIQDKLSNLLTSFSKIHSTKDSLTYMLEIWKSMLNIGEYVCAMFMDTSKTFDTVHHDLVIAKLGRIVFHRMLFSTGEAKQERARVNNNFST